MNQDRFVMSDPVWKTYPIKPVMRMSASGYKRKSGPCLRHVRLSPNTGHSASMSGFGSICSDLGPGTDGAGLPRACAPLTAPAALAWNVRTALRAKKGPARGSIEIRLHRLRHEKMKWGSASNIFE